MTLRVQADFDAGATRQKVVRLLERMRAMVRGDTSDPEKVRGIIDDYYELIENLGLPAFKETQLDPRETATFQRLNTIFREIELDIRNLFEEYKRLTIAVGRSYNRGQAILLGTEAEIKNTTAEVLTAGLGANIPQRGMFIAVETFVDDSRTNPDSTADLGFGGGACTLRKVEVFPVDHSNTTIEVKADDADPYTRVELPEGAASRDGEANAEALKPPKMNLPYEGRYYAYLGEAEFEGGRLKLIPSNEKVSSTTKAGLMPAPTPEEALRKSRRVLIDGTEDTYHQVERTVFVRAPEIDPGMYDSNFPYDFRVQYTLNMNALVVSTAVVMDPINFGERAWLEIQNLETSVDGQSWETIPGLNDFNYYNVLTDEANKQLNTRQANAILAPNKYAYTGKGLWVFGERQFRYLRLTVLQRTPILQPYEVIVLKQERQVVKTKKAPKILGIKIGKDSVKSSTDKREIELTYEESLLAFSGEEVIERDLGSYKATDGLDINILGKNLFSAGGTSVEKGAWSTSAQRTIVKNNVARYVVGIRELQILAAEYAEESVYISQPFSVPSPIRQVQLRADHVVPESFGQGDWIKYFISVDGGTNWMRIAPIDYPPQYSQDTRVPTVVQVNSNTPIEAQDDRFGYLDSGSPATEILMRIELSRPSDITGETPIVKRYALEILTKETTDQVIV